MSYTVSQLSVGVEGLSVVSMGGDVCLFSSVDSGLCPVIQSVSHEAEQGSIPVGNEEATAATIALAVEEDGSTDLHLSQLDVRCQCGSSLDHIPRCETLLWEQSTHCGTRVLFIGWRIVALHCFCRFDMVQATVEPLCHQWIECKEAEQHGYSHHFRQRCHNQCCAKKQPEWSWIVSVIRFVPCWGLLSTTVRPWR